MTPITARAMRRERFAPLRRWIAALDANAGAVLFLVVFAALVVLVDSIEYAAAVRAYINIK